MKQTAQIGIALAGCLPFLLGRMIRYWHFFRWPILYLFVAAVFLLLWAGIAFFFRSMTGDTLSVLLPLNAAAAVVLLLLALQQLFFGHFWYNAIGHYTQSFYEPLYGMIRLFLFRPTSYFTSYFICFVLMVAASYAGCRMGKRR